MTKPTCSKPNWLRFSTTLRRTELVEAATAAGFKNPQVVAEFLRRR